MDTGGQALVKSLQLHGVERAFCVAGESYLPVLDAFVDAPEIQLLTCRQEGGVTFMAEAYANLEGRPGIAFVTRGPGACNAAIGVHTAMQSSTPLVLFVGLINTEDRDKEAFQDFDLPQMFGSLSKWAAVIDRAGRISEYVSRAMHIAVSGRPGPVVLGMPEEILSQETSADLIKSVPPVHAQLRREDAAQIVGMLGKAQRPLVLVGGGGWSGESCAALESFVAAAGLPVVTSFRRQDLFNHDHENYAGELGTGPNPALVERVQKADTVLVLGARLNEITTQGYTLFSAEQKIIHVYPDPMEFGKAYRPALAVQAQPAALGSALLAEGGLDGSRWTEWRKALHQAYLEWSTPQSAGAWNGADMTAIFGHLQRVLPKDSIVTTDAGNFSGWCQRYIRYGRPGRLLAPVSGAMGYAVPAAVAASLTRPEKLVLGICGDGGFMMTGQELATAVHHGAKPVIMICNNGMYGTIRMHQERKFPERTSATTLTNPDFVELARSYGAFAVRVEKAEDFEGAFSSARASGRLAVLEIRMDPAQITTTAAPS